MPIHQVRGVGQDDGGTLACLELQYVVTASFLCYANLLHTDFLIMPNIMSDIVFPHYKRTRLRESKAARLKSTPLADRLRQALLELLYKITGGLIPATPPPPPPPKKQKTKNKKTTTTKKQTNKRTNYLTPVRASHRRIQPNKYENFEATNITERHEVRNTRGF